MAHQAGREAQDARLSAPAEPSLEELAARLQQVALARGITVATAESCTGGLVGHAITMVAGSSGYYRGGVVGYADEVKVAVLFVPAAAIERHGAVSAQVAVAMAEGVRRLVGCDYGVAVTGVAGPDGGSDAKPVGLTYVAAAGPDGHEVRRHSWDGDRTGNKERSAGAALQLLCEVLTADAAGAQP
jgi:PncC family amidohydrolase